MATQSVIVQVEDDRTSMSPVALKRAVLDHLQFTRSKDLRSATLLDVCFALAHTMRDRLVQRWMKTQRTYEERDPKRVYYLSAEFLLGRFLANNLINLGLYELAERGLREYGIELGDVLEQEPDPGLGNGGLGRLAACYLDSMATLELPGYGYGIRYEFGIFRQEIKNGWQVERPDEWLRFGQPWEIARPERAVEVRFGGWVESGIDQSGRYLPRWVGGERLLGVPYDYPIAGYGNNTVNTLRLWSARASEEFDLEVFNDGDYRRAVEQKALSESISKVLYPRDDSRAGKELRLKQQYFFVACSVQDIVRRYKLRHDRFDAFADKVAVQLNDTHPAITVAELMRVLVDVEQLDWERAWELTQRTLAYTNHTLLPEALESWPLELFERLLPRHLSIIYEINHRFLRQVHVFARGDDDLKRRISIIGEAPYKHVRMAHLAVVGSHSVNGVAALHSDLLRTRLLADFARLWPERFNNKTNGVTPRRWLLQCNRPLAAAISARIGDGWIANLDQLERLDSLADDAGFHDELAAIKRKNKEALCRIVHSETGVAVDPDSLFDVQVKRIHEYKRQLLNCLHVIALYRRIKLEGAEIVPRTVLFGGKAAPGYAQAKKHIKLINDVAAIVNGDPAVRGQLRCVFVPNYRVSLAERIFPASDLSEQISMAGKEASGTGNMKFQMNGALTMGTLDGANIEIREEVGADNFFLFGKTA
ncbi:MAG TPA: glycogen/starch/alpha-glucan phosphorylase, partial [Polyangiaceae bacterium]|nr:glycogen/starch/alpha-glucan phosphorylase [Polyangiaceae bacterium]